MSETSTSVWKHPASRIFVGLIIWNIVAYGLLVNSFSLFIGPLVVTYGFSVAAVSLISSITTIAGGIFLNFIGRLMGKVSSRVWFTSVAVGLVLVCVGYSLATELWQFYALGLLFGILAGLGIFATVQVVIPAWFSYPGTYLGIAAGAGGAGAVIASPILGFFIASGGHVMGFTFEVIVALVTLVPLGLFVLKLRPSEIGAKPYGIEKFEAEQAAKAAAASTASEGQEKAVFAGYSEAEARKMPQWWLIWPLVCLLPALSAIFLHVPGALADKGLDALILGSVVASYQFGVMLGQMILGWVSERIGAGKTVFLWAGVALVASAGFALYNEPTVLILAVLVFVLGLIRALTTVGLPVVVKHLFGMKAYSKIFTSFYTIVMFGGAAYFVLMGWLKDVTGEYTTVFLIVAGIAAVILILLIAIISLGQSQEKKRLSGEWQPKE